MAMATLMRQLGSAETKLAPARSDRRERDMVAGRAHNTTNNNQQQHNQQQRNPRGPATTAKATATPAA